MIMSPEGDLYQEYEGTTSEVTAVYPDFSTKQPVLYFVCTSSRVAEGLATPDAMIYYFNGTQIKFESGVSTGTFAGVFKQISPSSDNPYYGLQILKNIVELSGFASAVITHAERQDTGLVLHPHLAIEWHELQGDDRGGRQQ
jgi:hypothetical protein